MTFLLATAFLPAVADTLLTYCSKIFAFLLIAPSSPGASSHASSMVAGSTRLKTREAEITLLGDPTCCRDTTRSAKLVNKATRRPHDL